MPKKVAKIKTISAKHKEISSSEEDHSLRMEAVHQFIAGMAREIQHPLYSLSSQSHKLIEKYKDRPFEYIGYKEYKEILKTLRVMRDQAKYCADTTNRLINISKKKVGIKDTYCSPAMAVNESSEMLKHLLETSDVRLKIKLNPGLPRIAINLLELSQVLVNVLTNAIQSMPAGGAVQLKVSHNKRGQMVVFECSDSGIGIPTEHLKKVFDPFFTTKQRGLQKSSGLGLAIVYSIIQSYKGNIQLKSDLRDGTTVGISVPVYKEKKRA